MKKLYLKVRFYLSRLDMIKYYIKLVFIILCLKEYNYKKRETVRFRLFRFILIK